VLIELLSLAVTAEVNIEYRIHTVFLRQLRANIGENRRFRSKGAG